MLLKVTSRKRKLYVQCYSDLFIINVQYIIFNFFNAVSLC